MTPDDFLPQAEIITANIRASLTSGSYAYEAAGEIATALHQAVMAERKRCVEIVADEQMDERSQLAGTEIWSGNRAACKRIAAAILSDKRGT
jgi:hypothetical protein